MRRRILDALLAAQAAKEPVALVTDLASGLQTILSAGPQQGDTALPDVILAEARERLAQDRSGLITYGEERWFVQIYTPPLRLLEVGAVHVAQPLAQMAAIAGYDVTVIDPRRAFATEERFPGVTLDGDWPDEALDRLRPDMRTAVVALTHDPKLDDPALVRALASPAFYVGALGSRKTHAKRLERLKAGGLDDPALARIRGPVGLDIGAVTPAEIAVSILAEITAALRGGPKQRD